VSSRRRRIEQRTRTVPQAEHPRGTWLVPISGVFFDAREKYPNPFGPPQPFSNELEAGVLWRSATEDDRNRMIEWHEFFREFHAESESELIAGADSVLSPARSSLLEQQSDVPARLDAFIIALSLYMRVPLVAQFLRFEIEESPDERLLPHSGNTAVKTVNLPGWDGGQPITHSTISAAGTYPDVKRIRDQPLDNGLARSIGAYRAATSSHVFIDAIPILACAALEALTGTQRSGRVIDRIIPRYASFEHAGRRLDALYRLRNWFAHGADIPDMRDPRVRVSTLDEGLEAVKEILRAAMADLELLAAAEKGTSFVSDYLDA
jgi:hypothetical protein